MLTTGFSRLKRKLTLEGITYDLLATKMHISKQAISRKMNGTSQWTLEDIYLVADVLGLSNSEILAYFPRELA